MVVQEAAVLFMAAAPMALLAMVFNGVTALLYLWAHNVAQRRRTGRWRLLLALPALGNLLLLAGAAWATAALAISFQRLAQLPPPEKALALAAGIDSAQAGVTTSLGLAALLYACTVVGSLIGMSQGPAAAPPSGTA
jgi:endonuclease/exonuclease/phosphatase (EEP) superfamily protein YafD